LMLRRPRLFTATSRICRGEQPATRRHLL
jgi:hypothetical protein